VIDTMERRKVDMSKYARGGKTCPECGRAMSSERTDTGTGTVWRYRYCIACDASYHTRQVVGEEEIIRKVEKRD